jgi:ATP-dependent DNA helicase RecQ
MANALYENRFVSIYHAGLSSNDQKNILQHFVISDSVIRFVICTVAFGLGVNISDVRIVMHWGVSGYVLQYWQEVGRAGRDGQKATAYMYATKPSIVHANADMKKCVMASTMVVFHASDRLFLNA